MKSIAYAACLLLASPAVAQTAAEPAVNSDEAAKNAPKKGDDFDLAKLMGMFDKMFPAQPEPPPERLALAQSTADGMLPDGTYAALFDDVMSGLVDRMLSLSPADFDAKDAKATASRAALRDQIAKGDPHFEERMRITRRVISEELIKLSAVLEPKLREGLARSIARRFDEAQLKEINAFLATDSGRAFAGQTMRMWFDPDVLRSMMQSFPHMITAMPGAIARLEAETAHLPKPKKTATKKAEAKAEE